MDDPVKPPTPDTLYPEQKDMVDIAEGDVDIAEGDIIQFGEYHGSAIQWQVLFAEQKDRVFLISLFGLDCKAYNSSGAATWKTCSLQKWLNKDFYESAFSEKEREMILKSETTKDYVYILSFKEAEQFLGGPELRRAKASAYAISKNARTIGNDMCYWWLRDTVEGEPNKAYCVSAVDGLRGGSPMGIKENCVRPVIWVSRDMLMEYLTLSK